MNLHVDGLLSALRRARGKGLTIKQLAGQLHVGHAARKDLRRELTRLLQQGSATYDGHTYRAAAGGGEAPAAKRRGAPREPRQANPARGRRLPAVAEAARARRPESSPSGGGNGSPVRQKPRTAGGEVVGTIHVKPQGYAFVTPLFGGGARDEDLFIPPQHVPPGVLDGDVVRARVLRGRDGRLAGEVLEVVERRRQLAIGIYQARGKATYVIPHDKSLTEPIVVPRDPRARDGDMVKVRLRREATGPLQSDVVEVLGNRGTPKFEVLAAAYAEGFSDEFEPATRVAADSVLDHVLPEEIHSRRDLRQLALATIDGEDARDFDDAVHVSRTPSGYRLVVAIADVAHYVRPGGPLDREALRRATSVYFPGMVLPMLPERLSNGICSLNPDVDRLCMVADMALDSEGRPLHAELYEATMRSHARLTYDQVARALEGDVDPHVRPLLEDLKVGHQLSKKLTERRKERGAIDFDLPEAKVVLDEEGFPRAIVRRPRNDAHRLIEEFMLAANEATARFFDARGLPTVYRVHDAPDAEKLQAFAELAREHGFDLPEGDRLNPQQLNEFLRKVEGKPQQKALNSLLLRAMMQAQYSPDNIGHYGLAAPTYLHFTSPIRRYPDLMVHRLLKEHWARGGEPLRQQEREELDAFLAGIAAQCSDRERAAMRAERDVDAFYAALFMQDKVGQRYHATVSGVVEFGLFCELDEVFVEGLVPAESLGEGLELDREQHRLIVGKSGRSYGIGDRIEVIVESVDPARRRITLALAGGARAGGWLREEDLATSPPKAAPKGPRAPRPPRKPPPRGSPRGRPARRTGRRGDGR